MTPADYEFSIGQRFSNDITGRIIEILNIHTRGIVYQNIEDLDISKAIAVRSEESFSRRFTPYEDDYLR